MLQHHRFAVTFYQYFKLLRIDQIKIRWPEIELGNNETKRGTSIQGFACSELMFYSRLQIREEMYCTELLHC